MSEGKPVDRCDCINKSFEQLKAFGSFDAAIRNTGATMECGGCAAYLKLVFETGETEFAIADPRINND